MSTPHEFFTVSRVCELTGLPLDRLVEIEEALGEEFHVRRTPGGNRLFTQDDIERLQEVRRLMDDEGWDLSQVKATLFPVIPQPSPTPADTLPGYTTEPDPSPPDNTLPEHDTDPDPSPPEDPMEYAADPDPSPPEDPMEYAADPDSFPPEDPMEYAADPDSFPPEDPMEYAADPDSFPPEDRTDDVAIPPTDETDDEAQVTGVPSRIGDDVDPAHSDPAPLPVDFTVDILLEAAEGLVQENLKLRHAVDSLGERCLGLEERLGRMEASSGGFWRRLLFRD
jgi:hypothetical protein